MRGWAVGFVLITVTSGGGCLVNPLDDVTMGPLGVAVAGEPYRFELSPAIGGQWEWNFGDGTTMFGPDRVDHIFLRAGHYVVTATKADKVVGLEMSVDIGVSIESPNSVESGTPFGVIAHIVGHDQNVTFSWKGDPTAVHNNTATYVLGGGVHLLEVEVSAGTLRGSASEVIRVAYRPITVTVESSCSGKWIEVDVWNGMSYLETIYADKGAGTGTYRPSGYGSFWISAGMYSSQSAAYEIDSATADVAAGDVRFVSCSSSTILINE